MGIAVGEGVVEAFGSEQRETGSLNKQCPGLAARYARTTTEPMHDYEAWCVV